MNAYRSRPNRLPWPPLLLLGSVAAAILLGALHPLPLAFAGARPLGGFVAALAILIDIWAVATLQRSRTTFLPHRGSTHLVTEGPFRFSRNPIYVANVLLIASLALITHNGWFLPLALIDGLATHFLAIRREESHLVAMFGYKYEAYCRAVRRWI